MDAYIIAQWTATILIAVGLIITVRTNGKNQQTLDTKINAELTRDIKSINDKLEHPTEGLPAIRRDLSEMKTNWASTSTSLAERVKRTEADILGLKGG